MKKQSVEQYLKEKELIHRLSKDDVDVSVQGVNRYTTVVDGEVVNDIVTARVKILDPLDIPEEI